jgi:hypothetical protein
MSVNCLSVASRQRANTGMIGIANRGNFRMHRPAIAALAALIAFSVPAHAERICAWLVESNAPGNTRNLELWLQSAQNFEFGYDLAGRGLVSSAGDANRPAASSLSLSAGQEMKIWSFGEIFYPPGKIDVTVEIHRLPIAGAVHTVTPVLTKFVFRREIPPDEKDPPATLATRQCQEIEDEN